MPSDIKYSIYKYFKEEIIKIIEFDLTERRIQEQKLAFTKDEIKKFINDNILNINETIYVLIEENNLNDIEICKKTTRNIIKIILYEYIIYED